MNTTQLECFMAVSNFLNFSRAAEQLRITQPAVSHQINALEDELGVKLFHRTSKNVRLTHEGYLFTQYASDLLRLVGLSKARMKECRETMPERIGIGCHSITELRMLDTALRRLRTEHPALLPILRIVPFDSLENQLADGDIQVMFSFRGSAPRKTEYRELYRCPIVCVCGENHALAQYDSLTMEQLRSAGRIATCRPPICPPELFAIQGQAVAGRSPGQMLFCDTQEVMCSMAQAGYAFAVMAKFPGAELPGLRYIPLPELKPLSFGAVYLAKARNTTLRRFLKILEESANTQD